jgi:hypothetical protein
MDTVSFDVIGDVKCFEMKPTGMENVDDAVEQRTGLDLVRGRLYISDWCPRYRDDF